MKGLPTRHTMFMAAWLSFMLALLAGCSPSEQSDIVAENKAKAIRLNQERQNAFAAKYDAVWPELFMDGGEKVSLSVDVQRRLAGKRVALDILFPNVREENDSLILSGFVISAISLELEFKIDSEQLEFVRNNRDELWVAVQIESVTPKREVRADDNSVGEGLVYYAAGRVLGLASGVEAGSKE